MSSNGFFSSQRNSQHRNANAGTTFKRRNDNRAYNGIGGVQEERNRYAPPQKRPRSQPQTQFRSGMNLPLYHHHGVSNNMSRVSQSYNNYGDVITCNSSFVLPNNDSNTNYHRYGNPNPQFYPQFFPISLPYRKLDISFDSLPEWAPNQTLSPNFKPNTNSLAPAFTNVPNSFPLNHSNMVSIVSQSMPQPIVLGKELTDLLSILNNEKEKETSEANNSYKLPPGLSFDDPSSLKVRHESVIKSLYSDMPRQCSSCGLRFKSQEDHSNHMDWHVRKNRSVKVTTKQSQKPKKSRDWFASMPLWLSAATGVTLEGAKASFGKSQKKKEEEHQEEHVVPADEDQKLCALCKERFEDFFSHEADDWMYKDALYLTKNGPIVHVKCMPETRVAKDSRELPRFMSVSVPLVANAIIC